MVMGDQGRQDGGRIVHSGRQRRRKPRMLKEILTVAAREFMRRHPADIGPERESKIIEERRGGEELDPRLGKSRLVRHLDQHPRRLDRRREPPARFLSQRARRADGESPLRGFEKVERNAPRETANQEISTPPRADQFRMEMSDLKKIGTEPTEIRDEAADVVQLLRIPGKQGRGDGDWSGLVGLSCPLQREERHSSVASRFRQRMADFRKPDAAVLSEFQRPFAERGVFDA